MERWQPCAPLCQHARVPELEADADDWWGDSVACSVVATTNTFAGALGRLPASHAELHKLCRLGAEIRHASSLLTPKHRTDSVGVHVVYRFPFFVALRAYRQPYHLFSERTGHYKNEWNARRCELLPSRGAPCAH